MFLTLVSLYLFATVLTAAFLAAYSRSKGRTPVIRLFSVVSLGVSVYLLGYVLELNSVHLTRMVFWNQVQYLFIPFYPALWLMIALVYTRTIPILRARTTALIMVIPVATFLLRLTNRYHWAFYSSLTVEQTPFFPILVLGKGPWYYVQTAFVVACFLIGLTIYVLRYRRLTTIRRVGYNFMLLAAMVAIVGLAANLLDPASLGLDYSALVLPGALVLQMLALLRYDFLSIRSLAREMVFEHTTDGMIVVDEAMGLTDRNTAAARIIPDLSDARIGTPLTELIAGHSQFVESLERNDRRTAAATIEANDGRCYSVKLVTIHNGSGLPAGRLIQLVDCTEEKLVRERLLLQASTDSLTGLPNRGSFLEQAEAEFRISRRRNQPTTAIMLDIDHFKSVNDTYGHAAGDQALCFLAQSLRDHFRKTDLLGRIGGEEFAVLMPDTDQRTAWNTAETLRAHISAGLFTFEGEVIDFTVSLGVAGKRSYHSDFGEILQESDRCLYASKAGGRNRTTASSR